MTHTRYICWLNFRRINKVECTTETAKYIFTDQFDRFAKSASTHRVRSSMPGCCNTMKHYYNERIKVLGKELGEAETLFNQYKNTYMV